MLKAIGAESYQSIKPLTVLEDSELFTAIHLLLEHRITGVTVVNSENHVVGMLSELDCLKAILDGSYYGHVGGKVSDYMTSNVDVIENVGDLDILAIAKMMVENNRRRYPLVHNGKYKGQVSCRSILQAFKNFVAKHDPKEDSILE